MENTDTLFAKIENKKRIKLQEEKEALDRNKRAWKTYMENCIMKWKRQEERDQFTIYLYDEVKTLQVPKNRDAIKTEDDVVAIFREVAPPEGKDTKWLLTYRQTFLDEDNIQTWGPSLTAKIVKKTC